ncbi:RNA 2',3'-cyclic phosphodiesterase [Komagataeibacter sp. SM21]|uniref:RNA 2',3'-cyclic phosphodiesterase n=1 Tax=Komagataeibacter sp. SM21 TaxID=3242899 RepID=UPI0035272BC6
MRLFIGLELPSALAHTLGELRGSLPDVAWYPPESYHLTLHFVGEVTHGHFLEEMHHALSAIRAAPPSLILTVPGLFEPATRQGPDTLWMGCAPDPALVHLQNRIRATMTRLPSPFGKAGSGQSGAARPIRRFVPHISLGQMRHPDPVRRQRWLVTSPPACDAQSIGHFTLFRSLRHGDMPFYEPLEHYPLHP